MATHEPRREILRLPDECRIGCACRTMATGISNSQQGPPLVVVRKANEACRLAGEWKR
jgi:hypothetical protein